MTDSASDSLIVEERDVIDVLTMNYGPVSALDCEIPSARGLAGFRN
jgi:hypothetical protein